MKKLIKISSVLLLIFLTSCKTSGDKELPLENAETQNNDEIKKSKIEVRVSCGEGRIEDYLSDGWIIVEEYSEEKICTWKSFPASKDCDMEKDKGCKITKPDKVGEEKVYLLERK